MLMRYLIWSGLILMTNIRKLTRLVVVISFLSILIFITANAESNNSKEMQESYYEVLMNDSHFIASRGIMPESIDQEWKDSIKHCWLNSTGYSYHRFDRSIVTISSNNELLIVELSPIYMEQINESRIDDMYYNISYYCEKNENIKDIPVVFMWVVEDEDIIVEYDSEAFEKAKNSSNFVAARGIAPTFADENERFQWSDTVFEARHTIDLETFFSNGILISYGFIQEGAYIEVGVNEAISENINNDTIDDIYSVIEEHYGEKGINNIPVVFIWEKMPIEDEGIFEPNQDENDITVLNEDGTVITYKSDEAYIDGNGNLVIIDNNSAQKEDKSTQTTSGFTCIMLILCLLILVKIRK